VIKGHAHSAHLYADMVSIHPDFVNALAQQCSWLDPAISAHVIVDVLLAIAKAQGKV
jgi:hypothetical protein